MGGAFRLDLTSLPPPARKAGLWTVFQVGAAAGSPDSPPAGQQLPQPIRSSIPYSTGLAPHPEPHAGPWQLTASKDQPGSRLHHFTLYERHVLMLIVLSAPCYMQVGPQWGAVSVLPYPLVSHGEGEEVPPLGLRLALPAEPRVTENEVLRVGWWDERSCSWRQDGIRWGAAAAHVAWSMDWLVLPGPAMPSPGAQHIVRPASMAGCCTCAAGPACGPQAAY
jgi:hypothetical protein